MNKFGLLCIFFFFIFGCLPNEQDGITNLLLSFSENTEGKKVITIELHPLEVFNGEYIEQGEKINNAPYFKNKNDSYLYFYDQAEGGEKGWSLDHRKPDGIKDHYSGAWYYLEKFKELDESCTGWSAVPTRKNSNISNLSLSINKGVGGKKEISISLHPIKDFNGIYIEQIEKINNASYFRNENGRYLYFYDQAEGGEKGWSLDHRKPDGIKDHYSGGWYYLDEFQELDENCTNWNELDQGIF